MLLVVVVNGDTFAIVAMTDTAMRAHKLSPEEVALVRNAKLYAEIHAQIDCTDLNVVNVILDVKIEESSPQIFSNIMEYYSIFTTTGRFIVDVLVYSTVKKEVIYYLKKQPVEL